MKRVVLFLLCLAVIPVHAQVSIGSLTQKISGPSSGSGPTGAGLSESTIGSGLKQALQVGTQNTVSLTGRPGGYFDNPAIKILLPKNLKTADTVLRSAGQGPKLDEFIVSMNRAAEAAAPAAKKIFIDAITSMSIEDARKILSGGDHAATDYFRQKTSADLTAAFKPEVERAMSANGTAQQYNALAGHLQTMPFMGKQDLNINDYVVSQALNGLFYVLGQEEQKIRKDPAAQTTSLLKTVFGGK